MRATGNKEPPPAAAAKKAGRSSVNESIKFMARGSWKLLRLKSGRVEGEAGRQAGAHFALPGQVNSWSDGSSVK